MYVCMYVDTKALFVVCHATRYHLTLHATRWSAIVKIASERRLTDYFVRLIGLTGIDYW